MRLDVEPMLIDYKLIDQFKKDKNVESLLRGFLWQLAHITQACQGIVYEVKLLNENLPQAVFSSAFAFSNPNLKDLRYSKGEGFVGQVLQDKKEIIVTNIPADYLTIVSGLGKSEPAYLIIIPLMSEEENLFAIIELASFIPFDNNLAGMVSKAGNKLYELINNLHG